jgi:outer membrane protein OmpA-like peptidoglycan-associated protein
VSAIVAALWLALPAEPTADPSSFKVVDIVFRVEDIETQVGNLEVKETDTEIRIDLEADVLFEFDKADILPKAEATLTQVADVIRERSKGSIRVEGHTDSKGSDAYNAGLSRRRAQSVVAWLRGRQGLADDEFVVTGFGEARPVAANSKPDGSDDPAGRQKNRRVEIILRKG